MLIFCKGGFSNTTVVSAVFQCAEKLIALENV